MEQKLPPERTRESWLIKVGSYRILGMPVGNWLVLFVVLAVLGFVLYAIARREVITEREGRRILSRTETIVAQVSDLWVWRYEYHSRLKEIYRITLKQDDKEFTCDVAWPPMIRQWHRLEIGERYEFGIVRSGNRCYIDSAIKVDE